MTKANEFFSTEKNKNNNTKYENLTDEEIIERYNNGDNEALDYIINKYRNIVDMKVGKYFIIGAEKEDIVQEGLIGLLKAVKNFNSEKDNSFKTFANLCIERQLITAIKTSNRQKHQPLNTYVSLNSTTYDDNDDIQVIDILDAHQVEDPLDTVTKEEYYTHVKKTINKNLSKFEKDVLYKYVEGNSYEQIASSLDTPVKSVDNAIQRIRKKASRNIEN